MENIAVEAMNGIDAIAKDDATCKAYKLQIRADEFKTQFDAQSCSQMHP
jgi:hypothetical protein